MRLIRLLSMVVLGFTGCSSSSGGGDAGPSGDGVITDVAQVDGPAADGPGRDIPALYKDTKPGTDSKPPKAIWTIAAEQKAVEWDNGYLALHPTQAKTLAVKLEVSSFDPNVVVAVSHDLGKSIQKATVKTYANPGPGHYDTHLGFGYDPTKGSDLALLTQMPTTNPSGPDYDSLVFATSTNGGVSFTVSELKTNPWPPDGMKLVAGPKSRLAIRSQHVLYVSEDLGQSLKTVFDDSKLCLDHGDFAVRPGDAAADSVFIIVCKSSLLRCEKKKCSPSSLPAGFKPSKVEWSSHDPNHVVATGSKQALVSTDGGKTFKAAGGVSFNTMKIVFDPRKGKKNVYLYAGSSTGLHRSTDGGNSYHDITPPKTIKPPAGTYVRDVDVAADGAVIVIAHPGVLRLAPP